MNEEEAREVAHRILEEFEDLLTENGIVIPSDDRTGDPSEAHLFGMEYSRLEEAIVKIIPEESQVLEKADATAEDDWPVREIAIGIVDKFEDLLDEKGIMVPSEDREGGMEKGGSLPQSRVTRKAAPYIISAVEVHTGFRGN
jgi:hypothetical protein